MTNEDLTTCLKAYRQDQISKDHLLLVFEKLVERCVDRFEFERTPGIFAEAAELCLIKSDRCDLDKCKPFNYFTTIIMCYLRQIHRLRRRSKCAVSQAT